MSEQSSELLPNRAYKSLRIGLHDYMSNLIPFFSLEWFTDAFIKLFGYLCCISPQGGSFFPLLSFFSLLSTHSLVYIAPSLLRKFLRNKSLFFSAFGYDFFGTVTKTMITAMIKSPNSNSDSDDSDTSSFSHHKIENKNSKPHKYKSNIKSKLLKL